MIEMCLMVPTTNDPEEIWIEAGSVPRRGDTVRLPNNTFMHVRSVEWQPGSTVATGAWKYRPILWLEDPT